MFLFLLVIEKLYAMKVSELQIKFIEEVKPLLPDWKFIKSQYHFKKNEGSAVWYFHIGCINHSEGFDAVGNVAIEFKVGKDSLCIIGAELGNIDGIGQNRFPVPNCAEVKSSARGLHKYFEEHGLSFLRKYSNPREVVTTLKQGGKEAMLISPFLDNHQNQIDLLSLHYGMRVLPE